MRVLVGLKSKCHLYALLDRSHYNTLMELNNSVLEYIDYSLLHYHILFQIQKVKHLLIYAQDIIYFSTQSSIVPALNFSSYVSKKA